MKINPNSWHYRLVDWGNTSQADVNGYFHLGSTIQLCPYVRRIAFIILANVIKALLCIFVGFLLLWATFGVLILPILYYQFNLFQDTSAMDFLTVLSLISWSALGVGLLRVVKDLKIKGNIVIYTSKYYDPRFPPEKEPNIFTLYLQALHDKVCPVLEVDRQS